MVRIHSLALLLQSMNVTLISVSEIRCFAPVAIKMQEMCEALKLKSRRGSVPLYNTVQFPTFYTVYVMISSSERLSRFVLKLIASFLSQQSP